MKIELLLGGTLPAYSHIEDGAMDCYSAKDCDWAFENGTYTCDIPLGFKVDVPKDYILLLFSRSGMGFKQNISLVNSVGVIDCGFRGEVRAKLTYNGKFGLPPSILKGNRVCQMMLMENPRIYLDVVDTISDSVRGTDGFGSTGQ